MSDDGWEETPSISSLGGGSSAGGGFGGGFCNSDGSESTGFNNASGVSNFTKSGDSAGFRSRGGIGRFSSRGGSGRNGSGCQKCGGDGHFARECPKNDLRSGGGSRVCHNCGEEGHISRNCPKSCDGERKGRGKNCHKCGEEGHFAQDCANSTSSGRGFGGGFSSKPSGFGASSENNDDGGFGGGFGSNDDTAGGGAGFGSRIGRDSGCRTCKQSGHYTRDCPNKLEQVNKCRNCGKSKHFARDCSCERTFNPKRPPPVSYIPPEPSTEEEDLYSTIAQGINFDNYDNIPVEVTGPGQKPSAIRSFSEAGLSPTILDNIIKAKYSKPTPVQKYSLPIILGGYDLMSCAQTGSGKTASFLLPVLTGMEKWYAEPTSQQNEVQAPLALVIAPTRELAVQIQHEARKFAANTSIKSVVVYGGVSVAHQLRQVQNGCHLLVGTPGRLKDFVSRRKISLENIKYLILDEADRMLDMGFLPDVKSIVQEFGMPAKGDRQTLMFSATFPEEIQKLAGEFLHEYVFLTIGKVGSTHADIEQSIIEVDDSNKRDKLVELLTQEGSNKNLVFVQTKRLADFLASYLCQNGFPATSIHGDRFQEQREEALRNFRSGQQTVLIATAVAARGLDIVGVKLVINYDLPDEIEEYVHRIGRTGRIGNKGRALSFFTRGKDDGLARALVKILADSEQVVPDWLEEAAETAIGTGYGPKGGRFTSKDTRSGGQSNSSGRFNAAGNNDGWNNNNSVSLNFDGGGEESWD